MYIIENYIYLLYLYVFKDTVTIMFSPHKNGSEKMFKKMLNNKSGQIGIGSIIGVMVLIIIATSLLPTINTYVADYNGTGSGLLQNVSLFVVIGVLLAAVVGAGLQDRF